MNEPGRRQRGQAAAEYLVCVSLLAVALLLPAGGEASAAAELAHAIRGFFRACSFLLSIS
jgi:hypothetical protein